MSEDVLIFCHKDHFLGVTIGLFQYFPLVIGFASFIWGWRSNELLFVLYGYLFRVITISVIMLQAIFQDPLKNHNCILDPYDVFPIYGFPCWETSQAFGLLGFMISYDILYKKKPTCLQVFTGSLLIMVLVAMIDIESHYPHQIAAGCIYGLIISFFYVLWIKYIFSGCYYDRYYNFKYTRRKHNIGDRMITTQNVKKKPKKIDVILWFFLGGEINMLKQ